MGITLVVIPMLIIMFHIKMILIIKGEIYLVNKVIEATERFFAEMYENDAKVVSITPTNEGWELIVEIITDDQYTRKRAKNDLISVFKAQVNNNLEVFSYTREEIRERGKTIYRASM